MRRTTMLLFAVTVLLCWATAVMSDVPANVQAVMDKEVSGEQLTSAEKEILFGYLDEMNVRMEWGLDTEWGPDGWGYTAKDPASGGDPYSWYDITVTGTELWAGQSQDDTWSTAIPLPFTFPFYDSTFASIYISANMIIKFTTAYVAYYDPIPSTGYPYRIDPWCYDMYHLSTSHYYYQAFGDSMFVVSFHDARYYNSLYQNDPTYGKTLQVIMWSDGRIKFQYNSLLNIAPGSPYTSGIDDDLGSNGLSCGNSFSDGYAVSFYTPAPGIILGNPMVTPPSGNTATNFNYSVSYRNTTGTAPTTLECWIDGAMYTMTDPGGSYATGVTMTYGPVTHTVGTHNYYFYFEDGTYTARSPETGTHSGPTVYQPLSGNIDIGGGNMDFQNPVAAALAIQNGGLGGPVICNIYGGTIYDGQVDLPGTIPGLSSVNTLTWQSAPGASPIITSSTGHGFYLTGADYVTIRGLEISDCYFNGIYNYYSGTDYSTNNRYINNHIHGVGTAGSYSGINLYFGDDCEVIGNEIEGDYYGIYNYEGDRNLIANNMIYNTDYYGIYHYYGDDNQYYYNSVLTGNYYTMYKYYGSNTTVMDNIFYNTYTSGYAYYIMGDVVTYPLTTDYNDIYAPNGAYLGYYNGAHTTLVAFQTATGQDANSISADPGFASYTDTPDLHISLIMPSPVDGAGTPITAVTYDFDFQPRNISTPDIGADEFTYIPMDYCVIMEPEELTGLIAEDDTLDYMITIDNCGALNDTFDVTVTVTGETWNHQILDNTGTGVITEIAVNAGVIDSFICRVISPVGISLGDLSYGEVVVESQGGTDNILSDTSWTTTTGIVPITLPYSEDFDTFDGGYTSGGTGCWEWGDPSYGPTTSCSEPYSWGTEIDAAYSNNACCYLDTPPIELQALATLTFCHWYSIEGFGYDGGNVKISTDGGSTWNLLTPVGGYPGSTNTAQTCIPLEPVYYGTATTWTTAEFNLNAYAGETVIIRWTFGSDASVTYPGWYIDNVSILLPMDYCVDLTPETIYGGGNAGDVIDYQVYVENCGLQNDGYDLSVTTTGQAWTHQIMDVTGSTVITEIAVNSGVTDTFLVRVTIDPGAGMGEFSYGEVVAESQNGTLDNILSDTTTITTETLPFSTIPYDWVEINPARPGAIPGGINTGIIFDDDNVGPFPIGFSFPYYDCVYFDSIRVCSNGFASFTSTVTDYTNDPIPNTFEPNNLIAPYWDDMNPASYSYGSVWYMYDAMNDRFIVEWDSCAHFSTNGVYTFELILYPTGDVDYQYKELTAGEDTSATVGIENATGTVGIQCTYNGSGPINPTPGMGIHIASRCYPGPDPVDNLVIWLVPTDTDMRSAVLDWSAVSGAAQYKIYKSYEGPTSGYTLVDSTTLTQWTDTDAVVDSVTSFYYVTTDDGMLDFYDPNITFPDRARHPAVVPMWIQEKYPEKEMLRME